MRFPKSFGRPVIALLLLAGIVAAAGAALTTHAQSASPEQSAELSGENTSVGGFVTRRRKANGRIVYQSIRNNTGEIFVMNADGTGQTRLTNNPGDDAEPAWSPDGFRIAYTSVQSGNTDVYVMYANGSG